MNFFHIDTISEFWHHGESSNLILIVQETMECPSEDALQDELIELQDFVREQPVQIPRAYEKKALNQERLREFWIRSKREADWLTLHHDTITRDNDGRALVGQLGNLDSSLGCYNQKCDYVAFERVRQWAFAEDEKLQKALEDDCSRGQRFLGDQECLLSKAQTWARDDLLEGIKATDKICQSDDAYPILSWIQHDWYPGKHGRLKWLQKASFFMSGKVASEKSNWIPSSFRRRYREKTRMKRWLKELRLKNGEITFLLPSFKIHGPNEKTWSVTQVRNRTPWSSTWEAFSAALLLTATTGLHRQGDALRRSPALVLEEDDPFAFPILGWSFLFCAGTALLYRAGQKAHDRFQSYVLLTACAACALELSLQQTDVVGACLITVPPWIAGASILSWVAHEAINCMSGRIVKTESEGEDGCTTWGSQQDLKIAEDGRDIP